MAHRRGACETHSQTIWLVTEPKPSLCGDDRLPGADVTLIVSRYSKGRALWPALAPKQPLVSAINILLGDVVTEAAAARCHRAIGLKDGLGVTVRGSCECGR